MAIKMTSTTLGTHDFEFNVMSVSLQFINTGETSTTSMWFNIGVNGAEKIWKIGEKFVLCDREIRDLLYDASVSVRAQLRIDRLSKENIDFMNYRESKLGIKPSLGSVAFFEDFAIDSFTGEITRKEGGELRFNLYCSESEYNAIWNLASSGAKFSKIYFKVRGGKNVNGESGDDLKYESVFDGRVSIWTENDRNEYLLHIAGYTIMS